MQRKRSKLAVIYMIYKIQFIALAVVLFILGSCGSAEEQDALIGTWQLVEVNISGGAGSAWEPINTDKEITFDARGTYTSNGDICGLSTASDIGSAGRWLANDEILNFENCPDELSYEIIENELIIHFECIEQCSHKYRSR